MTATSAAMFTSPRLDVVVEVSGVDLRLICSINQTDMIYIYIYVPGFMYVYIFNTSD